MLGAPWADSKVLAQELAGAELPGVRFVEATFTPQPTPGMDMNPKLRGERLEGIEVHVTNRQTFKSVETGVHILHAFYNAAPDKAGFLSRPEWLSRLSGTDRLLQMLSGGATPETIVATWQPEVSAFREARAKYLLYD